MAKAKPVTGLNMHAPTAKNARIIAKARLEDMYAWAKYVDNPYYVHELHDMRIAAKRLRYTLEIFEEVLPDACKPLLKEVEQIQEELGTLHDSDVMIALLRPCLGSQDSGIAYEEALIHARNRYSQKQFTLQPELVADLLNPQVTPTAEQRYGLEHMLLKQQQQREEQYAVFHQHWSQLQARDFRAEILASLDT
ncbi:MAG: hypothetical protein NVSMB33_16480 [Ktedonobacteraceae bacterium]